MPADRTVVIQLDQDRSSSPTTTTTRSSNALLDQKSIFCTCCKQIKLSDAFDGHQISKRFGKSPKTQSRNLSTYSADSERSKLVLDHHQQQQQPIDSGGGGTGGGTGDQVRMVSHGQPVQKIWCRTCVPKPPTEFFCSDCEQTLPRSQFAQAQLTKHKSDEDRLCRTCANLEAQQVEAVRTGETFRAEEIESLRDARREAGAQRAGVEDGKANA